jgi:sterol desaturase/sphingolipid hydroxylase (fatty acid hydroxylase superfamily)
LLGYSGAAVGVFAAVYQAHALLLHSNVRVGIGPLRWAIASPQFHHWHHAHERAAHDKNFAGQLSFLDALFGTLHLPGAEMPARYGIDDPVRGNYVTQIAWAFMPARRRGRQDVPADT